MSIRYTEFPAQNYAELRVDGGIGRSELADFIERFERFVSGRQQVSMLEIVDRMGPSERGTFAPAMRFRYRNARRLARLAVVTDTIWLRLLLRAVNLTTPVFIRTFRHSEVDHARRWTVG